MHSNAIHRQGHDGKPYEDGRVGETIALRGNGPKAMISAVVTGPGRARMMD